MRDHSPVTLNNFNGLYQRGDIEDVPVDHFTDCNNIKFVDTGFNNRDGIDVYLPYANVLKLYNYPKVASESILVLDTSGNIFDSGSATPYTPILTIVGMLDFGFEIFADRAYISPSTTVHGMAGEFLYVYAGDGTPARKAGGNPPIDADGALAAANSGSAGNVEAGIHIFGAVYETVSGFLTQIGPDTLPVLTAPGSEKVDLTNIPVSGSAYVTKVHIVATRAIDPSIYTGDTRGYEFFFVPDATVNNGTTTLSVSFFDSELLEDASHLLDLYSEIPAGVGLKVYHGRLFNWTQEPDIEQSNILVSYPGEPEAFDKITGIIQLQADHQPITICSDLRDILYIFKYVKTFAATDNGDVPSSWPITILDQGLGAALHGVAQVLDTGGVSIDYLIIVNYSGVYLFNGSFQKPELSWKIQSFWVAIGETPNTITAGFGQFQRIEIYNNSIDQELYIISPDNQQIIYADYRNGLDYKNIRWSPWTFDVMINSICLTNFNKLLIGSSQTL